MLAEWGNILVVSSIAITVFWGGWLRPFPSVAVLETPLDLAFPLALFVGIGGYCAHRARKMHLRYEAAILLVLAGAFLITGLVFLLPTAGELAGLFWFFFKLAFFVYGVIWLRGTLPRVRYDQLMSLGWKYLVPLGLTGVAVNAVIGLL
jgi:NADH-quinone oxidoreductase subunit H